MATLVLVKEKRKRQLSAVAAEAAKNARAAEATKAANKAKVNKAHSKKTKPTANTNTNTKPRSAAAKCVRPATGGLCAADRSGKVVPAGRTAAAGENADGQPRGVRARPRCEP